MATRKFPSSSPRCLGQFWLPGSGEAAQATGSVEVPGTKVELEVSPELTPWHTYTRLASGTVAMESTPDPLDMVILGLLAASPGPISLWGGHTSIVMR